MSRATLIHEWSKSDSGQAGITMEPHDKNLGGAFAHTFRVFTKDNHAAAIEFKVNKGGLIYHATESVACEDSISFNNSDIAETGKYITSLTSVDADFFIDEDYEFTTASLSLQSGKIKASKKITGKASIAYVANAYIISYTPYSLYPNVKLYGVVLAVQKSLKTLAEYEPINNLSEKSRDTIILVYKELVVNSSENSPFEKPSNWDAGNDYTGLTPLESEKPELGTGAVVQEPMDSYFFENGTYFRDSPQYNWYNPSPGNEWSNAVIHIKKNYSAGNYGAEYVSQFDGLVAELETEYSARFASVIVS